MMLSSFSSKRDCQTENGRLMVSIEAGGRSARCMELALSGPRRTRSLRMDGIRTLPFNWKRPEAQQMDYSAGAAGVAEAGIAGPENADVLVDSGLKKSYTQLASRRLGGIRFAESLPQM